MEEPRHVWWNFVSSSTERIEPARRPGVSRQCTTRSPFRAPTARSARAKISTRVLRPETLVAKYHDLGVGCGGRHLVHQIAQCPAGRALR
jgi:hypothetical protein